MRSSSATVLAMLVNLAFAGWFFQDLRPKDYPKGRPLDIHVGYLTSPKSVQKYPFYTLNYCPSSGEHKYVEG